MAIGFGYAGWLAFGQESSFATPPTGTNAAQTLTPGGDLTGGHFDIAINGITLATVVYNVTLVNFNALLLATFGSVELGTTVVQNVLASGGTMDAGSAFTLTYQGIYGSKPMPTLTFTPHSITGSTVTVASSVTGIVPTLNSMELLDEAIELKQQRTPKPVLGTTSETHSVKSKSDTSGSFKFQGQFANGIMRLLYSAFGAVVDADASGETTVYTHTYTRTDALPGSLSIWVDRDSSDIGAQFLYTGCQIDKLTFEQDADDMLMITAEIIGRGQEILVYPLAKPALPTFNQIDWLMVSAVTINSVSIPAKKLKIVLDNKLNKERYLLGSNFRNGVQRGGVVEVTGTVELEFQSTAQITLFENYTQFAVAMTWTGANVVGSAVPTPYSLAITMNNCAITGKTPNVKDWSVIQQEIDFMAFSSSVGALDEISAVLTNNLSTQV